MFKEDEVDETVLVDFQLMNYGHPGYDILYLLFLSSDLGIILYTQVFLHPVFTFSPNLTEPELLMVTMSSDF